MPALQYQNLPADQIKEIKGQLNSQWKIEANALNRSWFADRGKFNTAKAKLNAKYQQLELTAVTKMQQQVKERQRVQELISQPRKFTPAQEAAERMRLGPEAERLAFPKAPKPDEPLSVAQIMSPSLTKSIDAFFMAAPAKRGLLPGWGPKETKTKKGLIDAYRQWKEITRYDMMNPIQQRQIDERLDQRMAAFKRFKNWFSSDVQADLKIIRSKGGEIAEVMKDRALGISPLARTLRRQKKTVVEKIYGTGKEMRERYGFGPQEQKQRPIRQRNTRTGQERISYDGGRTWQMIGSQ